MDPTTRSFPTMPQSPQFINISGMPSANTTPVRKNNSKGGFLEAATATHKANIPERLGAKGHPQATLYAANAASANDTERQVYTVPSRSGFKDFYLKRSYGQVLQ